MTTTEKDTYRNAILEMVNSIESEDYLSKIYHYTKVKYEFEISAKEKTLLSTDQSKEQGNPIE